MTQELDHPDQAIDTDLPGKKIDREIFKAHREEYKSEEEPDFENIEAYVEDES